MQVSLSRRQLLCFNANLPLRSTYHMRQAPLRGGENGAVPAYRQSHREVSARRLSVHDAEPAPRRECAALS